MADEHFPIRSYQRIFTPDRRVYQLEGHRLPVPGGVPLRWLGYAVGALVGVLVLSGRSPLLSGLLALLASGYGLVVGGPPAGALVAGSVAAGAQLLGLVLGGLDWPLRLLVVPALVATLLTQATPDGRPAHRYALSRVRLWLSPAHRSLGRAVSAPGERRRLLLELSVAPDEHAPGLRRGRVHGPARVSLAAPRLVTRRRWRRGYWRARPLDTRGTSRQGSWVSDSVELAAGEVLEVGR